MNKLALIVIFALVLGGGGYLLFANMQNTQAPTTNNTMGTSPGMSADQSIDEQGGMNVSQAYTLEEVSQRNTPDNCWLVIDGNVYDVTRFISSHPGGRIIVGGCGKDASEMFKSRNGRGESHSSRAFGMLPDYQIGVLQ